MTDQLQVQSWIHRLHSSHGQACDDGKGDDDLRQDHRSRGIEKLQKPQYTTTPQQDRDEQTDDDRWQTHAGVDEADDEPTPRKTGQRQ